MESFKKHQRKDFAWLFLFFAVILAILILLFMSSRTTAQGTIIDSSPTHLVVYFPEYGIKQIELPIWDQKDYENGETISVTFGPTIADTGSHNKIDGFIFIRILEE